MEVRRNYSLRILFVIFCISIAIHIVIDIIYNDPSYPLHAENPYLGIPAIFLVITTLCCDTYYFRLSKINTIHLILLKRMRITAYVYYYTLILCASYFLFLSTQGIVDQIIANIYQSRYYHKAFFFDFFVSGAFMIWYLREKATLRYDMKDLRRLAYLAKNACASGECELAAKYYRDLMNVDTRYFISHCILGLHLIQQLTDKNIEGKVFVFNEVERSFKQADKRKPNNYRILGLWGHMLAKYAVLCPANEAEKLFQHAYAKCEKALLLKPRRNVISDIWGEALLKHATIKEGKEKEVLLDEAYQRLTLSLNQEPDDCVTLNLFASVIVEQSKMKEGNERDVLVQHAKEIYLRLEKAKKGLGSYGLARVCSLQGDEKECKKWLEKGEKTNMLPSRDDAMADDNLLSVREKEWFQAIQWRKDFDT